MLRRYASSQTATTSDRTKHRPIASDATEWEMGARCDMESASTLIVASGLLRDEPS